MILAHRRELVEQAAKHCVNSYPDKRVEIDMGKLHASGTADITVATVPSLQREDRLMKYDPKRFKLVLVDEAHHIVAPGYMKILKHFGLSEKNKNSPSLVGVSATFSRFDGLKLGAAIDEIVYHKDYVDMIDEKWLTGVIFTTVRSTADITKVKSKAGGDFLSSDLSNAVNTDQVNEITVRSWLAKAAGRKSTLVFCVDLAHVADLTQKFRQHGIEAHFVTGDTHVVERSQRLTAFRAGQFPVLLNCGVFTEGTDIPNIDCVILARPTKSRNLLVQMIGRGMRLHPDKENCHVMDMVSSLETGIVTTPTLFGLDPGEMLDSTSADDMKNVRERKAAEDARQQQVYKEAPANAQAPMPRRVTFTEYESVYDLISDTSGEMHIRAISQYCWVQISPAKWVLTGTTGTYLKLEKDTGVPNDETAYYRVMETRALPAGIKSKSPFAAPRELLKSETFADAVHGADKYASKIFPHPIISRNQRWRDGPATEGQLKFLNQLRSNSNPLTTEDVTKGKAADMITKVKHGARGRFADLEASKKRRERQEMVLEANRERILREKVSVGPLAA